MTPFLLADEWLGMATFLTAACNGLAVILGAVVLAYVQIQAAKTASAERKAASAERAEVKAAVARDAAETAKVKIAVVQHTQTTAAKLEHVAAEVKEVKAATNGMKAELVETVKAAAFAAGVKSETDKQNGGLPP